MLIRLTSEIYVDESRVIKITEDATNNAVVTVTDGTTQTDVTVTGHSASQVYDIIRKGGR